MSGMRFLQDLFRWMLWLYPAGYRAEFAEERQAVFHQAAEEAASHGLAALTSFALRELADLPGAALTAHLRGWRWNMIASLRKLLAAQPDRWNRAGLAGLPHLLFAVSYYFPLLITHRLTSATAWLSTWRQWLTDFPITQAALLWVRPASYWTPARVFDQSVQWAFGLIVIVVVALGWRRGWPRWSASWLGYLLLVALRSLITLIPQDVPSLISISLWLIGACAVYIWQTSRSPLNGLLALLPFYPMFFWFLSADGIAGTYPDMIAFGSAALLMSVAVTLMARTGSVRLALYAVVGLLLVVGSGFAYATTYYSNAPFPAEPGVGQVVRDALFGFLGMAVFGVPVWGAILWAARRRRNQPTA